MIKLFPHLRSLCLAAALPIALLPAFAAAQAPAALAPAVSPASPNPAPPLPGTELAAAPTNATVVQPTDCLFYPLVSKGEFPTSVALVEAWTAIYNYLDGPIYREHRRKLGEIWGEEPMFILTSVEIGMAQFKPVAERARKAGFPETLVEQISLCMALRTGNIEGLKDWLPRVQQRVEGDQPYLGDEALLPTKEGAEALAKFGMIALQLESDRKGVIQEIMEKPRMLAESDSVFRDLDAIDTVTIRLQNQEKLKVGENVQSVDWQAALPKEPRFQRLRRTGLNVLGHPYGFQTIGERPMVPKDTFQYFESMFKAGDWAPYRDPASAPGDSRPMVIDEGWTSDRDQPKVVEGSRVTPDEKPGAVADPKAPRKSGIPPAAVRSLPPDAE